MVSVSDVIRILKDIVKKILCKSCMLYLWALFDSAAISTTPLFIELNLICQFNEYDNFWPIFAGVGRYRFTKVVSIVGHSYLMQIILHK